MAATSELWVYNTTADEIEVDELGITLPAEDAINIAHFNQNQIWAANTLVNAVANGTVGVVSDFSTSPPTTWPVQSALDILQLGVNSYQVGLHKVLSPGVVDGRYYSAAQSDASLINNSISAYDLYATPVAYMGVTFNRIGVEVVAPAPNGVIHLGIYSNDSGIPGDLILDAGYVATDTVGQKEIAIDFDAPMEWYWLAAISNTDVTCMTILISGLSTSVTGILNDSNSTVDFAVENSIVFPNSFPSFVDTWDNPPLVWLRRVTS